MFVLFIFLSKTFGLIINVLVCGLNQAVGWLRSSKEKNINNFSFDNINTICLIRHMTGNTFHIVFPVM